ncbi:SGNH/GDSL hydrolase family protein [Tuwongella immobilis]|uniref:SGNH hydrolase-type esterase domain-containing protein n=1 Tax=Tuwongella immobilis TaxID=692036 RepID=A0A6C2YPX1_9BACT|nr:SGNH/GDSL hydrolase family protein [Tuwongella immobilis]VIP03516.1 Nodulin-26 OS=Blastopirellula marina DSM 3645 GN=DSM3645_10282 PE=4 SV=1: Lipase_GDSL_2 [Tuwongella immobilis]VTS04400.1 Nodulin-26 OS=Blastopirellula marina DSM 3645 GN=DSM3645_10282 PE=4 SV=1: Lipase_GDSL_2 [Tuwongella immobilis]
MKRFGILLAAWLVFGRFSPGIAAEPPAVSLRSGDRIVLVGGTLIEREQREGYWETALMLRHPNLDLTVRNLGWSGDTVFGEARAWFDPPEKGYQRLVEQTITEKPTVILLNYGLNESYAGNSGLERFAKQYERLLNDLSPAKARMVLMLPPLAESMPAPLPSVEATNARLEVYRQRIRDIAAKRGLPTIDIQPRIDAMPAEWKRIHRTDNGLHLSAAGYRRTATLFADLFASDQPWSVSLNADGTVAKQSGVTATAEPAGKKVTLQLHDATLPLPTFLPTLPDAAYPPHELRKIVATGWEGNFQLRAGNADLGTVSAADLAKGVTITRGPMFEQSEQVRKQVVLKNQHYFNKWRPQNDTYLYGFRKHEQGQNFKELAQFDPLIAAAEKQIAELRHPKPVTLVMEPQTAPLPR